jgi:hypothetical protein
VLDIFAFSVECFVNAVFKRCCVLWELSKSAAVCVQHHQQSTPIVDCSLTEKHAARVNLAA